MIWNADDAHLPSLQLPGSTFGLHKPATYKAENLRLAPLHSEFTLRGIAFRVSMPGEYNVYNALACLATLAEFGIPLETCVEPLAAFKGVERRFDVKLNDPRGFVMDDYKMEKAVHPRAE